MKAGLLAELCAGPWTCKHLADLGWTKQHCAFLSHRAAHVAACRLCFRSPQTASRIVSFLPGQNFSLALKGRRRRTPQLNMGKTQETALSPWNMLVGEFWQGGIKGCWVAGVWALISDPCKYRVGQVLTIDLCMWTVFLQTKEWAAVGCVCNRIESLIRDCSIVYAQRWCIWTRGKKFSSEFWRLMGMAVLHSWLLGKFGCGPHTWRRKAWFPPSPPTLLATLEANLGPLSLRLLYPNLEPHCYLKQNLGNLDFYTESLTVNMTKLLFWAFTVASGILSSN